MASKVHHVGMTVSDLDRTMAFYERLGFVKYDKTVDLDTPWIKTMTKFPNAHLKIQMLKLGETVLELLQYISPVGTNQAGMPTCNPGSAHLAIGVDDIAAEHARLSKAGVKFRSDLIMVPDGPLSGPTRVYAIDPDGYTVELLERPS